MPKPCQSITPAKAVTPNKAKRPQQIERQSISILKTEMRDIKIIYKQEIGLLQASVQKLEQENQILRLEINKEKTTREQQTRRLGLTKIDKPPCCNPLTKTKIPCRHCHRQLLSTDKLSRSQLRTPTSRSPFTPRKNSPASLTTELAQFMKELNKYPSNTSQMKQLPPFIKEWQQTMTEMMHDLQSKIKKGVVEINDLLKAHKQQLLSSISNQTDMKLSSYQQSSNKQQQNEKKIILEMPGEMKELRQSCGSREENYKKQIDLLQKQLVQENQNHASIVTAQQAQITDLRERLSHLANTYHEHIQIPIHTIRQKIQVQISKVKADFFKLHTDRTLNEIANSVITTVKKYLDYKDQKLNGNMDDQIKKMSLKLSEMKDESIKTLENITEIIISKNFQQQNPPRLIEDKAKLKEMELVAKKKDFLYQQLEYKCYQQKEYLTALEKYNNKLEESVRRNSQQKTIFEDWANYEQHFRRRQEEFRLHSDQVAAEFRQAQAELIEIKKTLLLNVQSNRDAICMFQQFQVEVTAIQSFKDELFNYLENEIKLSKAIEDEVEIFNNIFVSQFNKFTALQTQVPNIQKVDVTLQTPVMAGKQPAIRQDAQNYLSFKKEYLELFKEKRVIEAKVGKSLQALAKMHEEYLVSAKDKSSNIAISLDNKLLKDEWERMGRNIEHMFSGVRTIREFVVKNVQTLKKQCERSNQQFTELAKAVPTAISSFLHDSSNKKKASEPANTSGIISPMHSRTQY